MLNRSIDDVAQAVPPAHEPKVLPRSYALTAACVMLPELRPGPACDAAVVAAAAVAALDAARRCTALLRKQRIDAAYAAAAATFAAANLATTTILCFLGCGKTCENLHSMCYLHWQLPGRCFRDFEAREGLTAAVPAAAAPTVDAAAAPLTAAGRSVPLPFPGTLPALPLLHDQPRSALAAVPRGRAAGPPRLERAQQQPRQAPAGSLPRDADTASQARAPDAAAASQRAPTPVDSRLFDGSQHARGAAADDDADYGGWDWDPQLADAVELPPGWAAPLRTPAGSGHGPQPRADASDPEPEEQPAVSPSPPLAQPLGAPAQARQRAPQRPSPPAPQTPRRLTRSVAAAQAPPPRVTRSLAAAQPLRGGSCRASSPPPSGDPRAARPSPTGPQLEALLRALGVNGGCMRVAEIFAGTGLMSAAAAAALAPIGGRVEVVSVVEREAELREALLALHSDAVGCADVADATPADLNDATVMFAGAPCPGFSHMGLGDGLDNADSRHLVDVPRLLLATPAASRPRVLVIECTPGLLSDAGGCTFMWLSRELNRAGLHVSWRIIDVRFALPHHRERVVIVAVRDFDPSEALLAESVPNAAVTASLEAGGGDAVAVFAANQASLPLFCHAPALLTGGSTVFVFESGKLWEISQLGEAALQGMPTALAERICAMPTQKARSTALGNVCSAPLITNPLPRLVATARAALAGEAPKPLPLMKPLLLRAGKAPGKGAFGCGGVRYALLGGGSSQPLVCQPARGAGAGTAGQCLTKYPCATSQPLMQLLRSTPGALVPLNAAEHASCISGYVRGIHKRCIRASNVPLKHAPLLAALMRFLAQSVGVVLPQRNETWRIYVNGLDANPVEARIVGYAPSEALYTLQARALSSVLLGWVFFVACAHNAGRPPGVDWR